MNLNPICTRRDAHWYTYWGKPKHVTEYKDPKRKGEYRGTTLTDAKKENLFPSYSTVWGACVREYGLETWNQNQLLLASITHPEVSTKKISELIPEILEDWQREKEMAAEVGSEIHFANEDFLSTGFVFDGLYKSHVETLWLWLDLNHAVPLAVERTFTTRTFLYGGKIDLIVRFESGPYRGRLAIIDYKTKELKKESKQKLVYPSNLIQLAAYSMGALDEFALLINLILDRKDPHFIYPHIWEEKEYPQAFEVWLTILKFWQLFHAKGWKPNGKPLSERESGFLLQEETA